MAILAATELEEFRRVLARQYDPTWTKAQADAAMQAVEDRLRLASTQATLSNDIEAAAPGAFTAAQKQRLFGIWCVSAARRLGVI